MGTGRFMAALPCPHPGHGTAETLQELSPGTAAGASSCPGSATPTVGTALLLKNKGRSQILGTRSPNPSSCSGPLPGRFWRAHGPCTAAGGFHRCPQGGRWVTPHGHLHSATWAGPWHSLECPQVPLGLRGWHPAWHGAGLAAPGLPARWLRRGPARSRRLSPVHPGQKTRGRS